MDARWRQWLALALGFCAGNASMWWYLHREPRKPTLELLADARQALRIADYGQAERLARRALTQAGDSTAALLIAGEAAARLNHLDDAVGYYSRVPDTGNDVAFKAIASKADALFQLGRFAESEAAFRRALEFEPHNEILLHRFAALLDAAGRRWDSRPYLLTLVKLGKFTFQELCLLGNFSAGVDATRKVDQALEAVPGDPDPLLHHARLKLLDNAKPAMAEMLWRVVRARPSNLEAQGLLGTVLVELGSAGEVQEWQQQLPDDADRHPVIWFAKGLWSEQSGQLEAAARCYWECLLIEPDHNQANYQMGLVLRSLGRGQWAEGFARRAELLTELTKELHVAYTEGIPGERATKIAQATHALGRYWEAWAWNVVLVKKGVDEAASTRDRLKKILDKENPPQTLNRLNPASQVDLSHFPLPDWSAGAGPNAVAAVAAVGPERSGDQAAFVDSTPKAGIDFTFFNGDDLESKGMRLHQTLGGGVAAIDYDGDGWPDLHFTQGARQVFNDDDHDHVDRLYRNLGNGRFADVSFSAGVADNRYSQGAAVGDYDNDGFADLFISNIGRSRLYRNHGDGTFDDVTQAAGIDLNHFSTSGLLADINGDGHADIYEVTYVQGTEVFEMMCGPRARACTPLGFDGDMDHLLLSLGDGTFRDVTVEAGMSSLRGKGLGIVAADFERSGQLSLVVANDTEANFYLANLTPQRGAMPLFQDRATPNGLAYNREGLTQANMGIAADDCNGDGLLDLYITTYYQESKTLRLQQPGQTFVDRTREANLRDPGFKTLGFGTQFLDAELDGLPDLVVANGHVDDYSFEGHPFEMQPQYFRNTGGGRFVERPAESLGPYFVARHLGRALARLDWNRDGREDFAVSHVASPSVLITNATAGAGHFLAVRLAAVHSARDAIGAILTLKAGDFTRVREMTAGDGYYASNERKLVFGLGNHTKIDRLVVQWPAGGQQAFSDLAVDREYLIIEDRGAPIPLRVND